MKLNLVDHFEILGSYEPELCWRDSTVCFRVRSESNFTKYKCVPLCSSTDLVTY